MLNLKNNKITIPTYSDPSHGWAKVKFKLLLKLGIVADISTFSYVRKEYVYLEEDCDLSLLVDALKKKGITIAFKSHYSNKSSRIRNYARYPQSDIMAYAVEAIFPLRLQYFK
jgi:protein-disulfide isomerase